MCRVHALSKMKGNSSLITLLWDTYVWKNATRSFQHSISQAFQCKHLLFPFALGLFCPAPMHLWHVPVWLVTAGSQPTNPKTPQSARQPGKAGACHCTGWGKKRLEKTTGAHRGYRGQPKTSSSCIQGILLFYEGLPSEGESILEELFSLCTCEMPVNS